MAHQLTRTSLFPRWRHAVLACLAGLTVAAAAGCGGSQSRFADGNKDVVGPQLSPNNLTAWRPLDPISTDSPSRYRPADVEREPVKVQERPVAAGTLKVPSTWSPNTKHRPWQWVVVHHSATEGGGAKRFDHMHRVDNGWDELGYHFVIGNGSETPDGYVEVGSRWTKQKHGAHAKTPDNRFNELGVGICLVGNFEQTAPTQKQLQSLAVLTAYLMDRYDIPANRVIGHTDAGTTACPGRNLYAQLNTVRRAATQVIASGSGKRPVHASVSR